MDVNDLLIQSLQLLGLGMGSVFVILTLLIGVITLVSRIVPQADPDSSDSEKLPASLTIHNTEHIAAIQAAIHLYRRRR